MEKQVVKNKDIIINLQNSSNATKFAINNLIHQNEFYRAKELIENRLIKLDKFKELEKQKETVRLHDTISILGSRGSGKTSFLLSLLNEYEGNKDIKPLNIIDPTLIEEKGHVFLTIISQINDLVNDKLQLSDCSPDDVNYREKKVWLDNLRSLAHGLPTMDGVGSGLDDTNWQDAEYIMNKGLKSIHSSQNLENNFQKLIKHALNILGKRLFILALDDIDVDFRKGWPVLETIRKYLTCPEIIVILSGDLKLYSKAIRKQQWANFGKALLINEADKLKKTDAYNDLVTEMESQYLQKVMKSENRIRLSTLLEKVRSTEFKINIEYSNLKESEENYKNNQIESIYSDILFNYGIKNSYQAESFSSFLLSLPLRTQIQFLIESLNPEEENNILNAFLSDLYEKEVNVEMAINMPKMINVVILKLLIKEKVLADAYQLQPTSPDVNLNSCLSSLSFLFSQKVKKNPYLIFDYIIKIGYLRNLLSEIDYKNNVRNKYSIEELCETSGIFQDKVLRDITGNITAYLRGFLNYPKENSIKRYAGIIPILGLESSAKGKRKNNRIDYVFKNKSIQDQKLAFIPLSISSDFTKNKSLVTYSIYMLISTIGELIRKHQSNEDISIGLSELSQIRTYLMPKFSESVSKIENKVDEEIVPIIEDKIEEISINTDIELERMIIEWIERFQSNKINISPSLLGKISTRFFYAINSIDDEKISNLGDSMYRRIIAFLNSIIVEDIKENDIYNYSNKMTIKNINLNNPIIEDTIFIKNIDIAIKNKNILNFSSWFLSCPLLILYLPNDKKLMECYIKFIEGEYREKDVKPAQIFKGSIYYSLRNVLVRGLHNEFVEFFKYKNSKEGHDDNRIFISKININKPIFRSNKLSERVKVVELLYNNKIPYSLFINTEKKTIQESNNRKIREVANTLFQEEFLHPKYLREFRNFLETDVAINLDIVKKWKQNQ